MFAALVCVRGFVGGNSFHVLSVLRWSRVVCLVPCRVVFAEVWRARGP